LKAFIIALKSAVESYFGFVGEDPLNDTLGGRIDGRLVGVNSAQGNEMRLTVNKFIRTCDVFDAVIDFDKVIRDPGNPDIVREAYVGQHTLKQNNYGASNVLPDINLPSLAAGPVQPRRSVQPFSTISLAMAPVFSTNMNSIQVGLHKQCTSGVTLNAEYQFTHVLGTETFQNPATLNDSYGNIGGISPQVLQVSYSLPLPVGKGRRFLGTVSEPVSAIVRGWQLSGISVFQTSQPFSVNSVNSVQGSANSRADRAPGVPLYPSNKTKTQWFNAAAFRAPANFTYGNSAYNLLRGPGYQNWDMSLSKATKFDRVNLQLRVDAFNVFNHPDFGTQTRRSRMLTLEQ
jgi:hypothetical protein